MPVPMSRNRWERRLHREPARGNIAVDERWGPGAGTAGPRRTPELVSRDLDSGRRVAAVAEGVLQQVLLVFP